MPRTATILILVMVASVSQFGCVSFQRTAPVLAINALPVEEAPQIALAMPTTPTISMVSHQIEPKIAFIDARLPEEKKYYPGETDPRRMHDAMTILPMESFQPDFETALRQRIVNSLPNAIDYEMVEVRIHSCHVALDERERAENELLSDLKKWDDLQDHEAALKEKQRHRNKEDGAGEGFSDAILRSVFVDPIEHRKRRQKRKELATVSPQSLPETLTEDKRKGWNCRLNVDIVLIEKDGKAETIPVSILTTTPKQDWDEVESQIQNVVTSALDEFAGTLTQIER